MLYSLNPCSIDHTDYSHLFSKWLGHIRARFVKEGKYFWKKQYLYSWGPSDKRIKYGVSDAERISRPQMGSTEFNSHNRHSNLSRKIKLRGVFCVYSATVVLYKYPVVLDGVWTIRYDHDRLLNMITFHVKQKIWPSKGHHPSATRMPMNSFAWINSSHLFHRNFFVIIKPTHI